MAGVPFRLHEGCHAFGANILPSLWGSRAVPHDCRMTTATPIPLVWQCGGALDVQQGTGTAGACVRQLVMSLHQDVRNVGARGCCTPLQLKVKSFPLLFPRGHFLSCGRGWSSGSTRLVRVPTEHPPPPPPARAPLSYEAIVCISGHESDAWGPLTDTLAHDYACCRPCQSSRLEPPTSG